ncbi:MAG: hypothetical protein GTO17_02455 [Candidatus Aminicenantes bacterium]|nr:hypothetical protein [Candidatus Aminicenantes bacterium]
MNKVETILGSMKLLRCARNDLKSSVAGHGIIACFPKIASGFFLVILKDLFYQLMEANKISGEQKE